MFGLFTKEEVCDLIIYNQSIIVKKYLIYFKKLLYEGNFYMIR